MKALFVSRHNNDYDSIAPVADGWTGLSPAHQARFYFPTPEIRWRDDHRTRILRENKRIEFLDLWDMGASPAMRKWLISQWSKVTADTRAKRKFLQIVTENLLAGKFAPRLNAMLDDYKPDIIAFDWHGIAPRRLRFGHFGYQEIVLWAHANKVPIVSLPHGLVLYNQPQAREANMGVYHTLFVESEERRQTLLRLGGALPRIYVGGSPRYAPVWVERVARDLASTIPANPAIPGRVNIVYFGKKQVYDYDFARQNEWLAHLAAHPAVDLVIQPHPRGQRSAAFDSLARLPNVRIDARTPATALIGDAGMVSTLTSSVMVEAVVRGREILYPRFFNTVVTRFEERNACVSLDAMEATYPAIDRFLAGERVPRVNYDKFLKETVFGGGDEDTIGRICRHIEEIARENRH
ncbi:MAG: hypothetical protein WBO55_02825 [Rhizobiaceae bacterium]